MARATRQDALIVWTVLLGTICIREASAQPGEEKAPAAKVDVRVGQVVAFEDARFVVTLETSGVHMEGPPAIRPFYGRATLMPDSVTNKGFAFMWDVGGAMRAARGELRTTQIHLHWKLRPDSQAPGGEATPMLTVVSVSLSTGGRVAVAEVVTSPRAAQIVLPPTTTGPAVETPGVPAIAAAVSRVAVDESGAVHLEVWLPGGVTLAQDPTAMANVGRAEARRSPDRSDRINIDWTPSAGEKREQVEVNLAVNWIVRTASGTFLGGRTVLDLITTRQSAGVTGLQSSTRLVPPMAAPASRPVPAL